MTNIEELDKAIGAHAMWKSRLQMTIATGETDTPIETMCQDNECAFGKWLYSSAFTPMDKASIHYEVVKNHHAEFHQMAADIATLALDRKKVEAEQMLRDYGEFAKLSIKLTRAMMEWKKALTVSDKKPAGS